MFTHISKYIKSADLAVVPQETPFYLDIEGKKFVKNTPTQLGDVYKCWI